MAFFACIFKNKIVTLPPTFEMHLNPYLLTQIILL